ncbi:MAG: aminotransferase class III-fold pyridoxal phosphate-dependent enzyme [Alphaproteobacteria bacterium]|nr:aminotransferase class III-fold pyridoxal phosphate-dependent enzyme [Rickettsiales bacterium]
MVSKKKLSNNLLQMDLNHFWHPYSDISNIEVGEFPIFVKGKGSYLYDVNGKSYIDGISSWWCVNLGHSNKKLINAIKSQVNNLQQTITGNASNDRVAILSSEIASIVGSGLSRSFFCSDGSSAVECALRMARQYFSNLESSKNTSQVTRKYFVSLDGDYHGDTLGCISVGYQEEFHKEINGTFQRSICAKSPNCNNCPFGKTIKNCNAECFDNMERVILEKHEEIIGVIVEPLFQGAAGMQIYSPKYLQKLEKICQKYGILLILDEIATGFYRTGKMFAFQVANIKPDIIILGKAITGGYLPMSAVVATEEIYNSFRNGNTFYYGHTFSGNPILANLAIAAINLYKQIDEQKDIRPLCEKMESFAFEIKKEFTNLSTNHCGMIMMIDFANVSTASAMLPCNAKNTIKNGNKLNSSTILFSYKIAEHVAKLCLGNGLFIRKLGSVVYLCPPINIKRKLLNKCCDILKSSINEVFKLHNLDN